MLRSSAAVTIASRAARPVRVRQTSTSRLSRGFTVRETSLRDTSPVSARLNCPLSIPTASASLTTRGITNWKYGRIEMRGRFDGGAGLWPEFWMMGDRDWPWNGEIDILESWQGMLNANVIWAGKTPGYSKASSQRRPIASFGDPEWTSKFHTWRLDWDENHIAIFVDDMLLNEVQINKAANGDGSNGFNDPHYMILNLAVGGTAGGDPSATEFPARFEVDWVRVYQ